MDLTINLKMEKHLKTKLEKAKIAICSNWKRIFCNKLITFSTKYNVFNATAQAILFYGVQVWGAQKFEIVEYLLRFFLRKVFYLPINTPKYMYNLESGLPTMFISTLKLNADYLLRVVKMSDSRLPKLIMRHAIKNKTLFVKEWTKIAADCGITMNWEESNIVNWKKDLYEVIMLTDENERYAFMAKARASTE